MDLRNVDLFHELSWQYNLARKALSDASNNPAADQKDLVGYLKETTRILGDTIKLRERVGAIAEVEEFEAAVFQLLDEIDPRLRVALLDKLEGLSPDVSAIEPDAAAHIDDEQHVVEADLEDIAAAGPGPSLVCAEVAV